MKESLKTYFNRCRCCLESFEEDENFSSITEFFASQFFSFTRLELETDDLLSNHVCEYCHAELLRFSVFKKDLIEKQLKLYKLLNQYKTDLETMGHGSQEDDEVISNDEEGDYDEIDKLGSVSDDNLEEVSESEDIFESESVVSESLTEYEALASSDDNRSTSQSIQDEKKFICDICQNRFKTKQGMINHIKHHVKKQQKLNIRQRIARQKEINSLKEVEESSVDEIAVEKEAIVETTTDKENIFKYRCFCGYTFKRFGALRLHQTNKHGQVNKCHFGCNKNFNNSGDWIDHISLFHPGYKDDCLKMIAAEKSNSWHIEIMKTDPQIDDLQCQKCSYYAISKTELVSHYQLKHSKTAIPNGWIQKKQNAKNPQNIKQNKKGTKTIQEEIIKPAISKPCVCICEKAFQFMGKLKRHQNVCKVYNNKVDGDNCLQCNLCSKSYIFVGNLRRHQRIVHKM